MWWIIEERIDEIHSLKRKYGNTITDILNYEVELEEEINRIESLDEENQKTKAQIRKIEEEMDVLCTNITDKRKQKSIILNSKINKELMELEMKNAKFNAKIIETDNYTNYGKSYVEFVITTNLGEDEKQLNKIASGGELSRIMLAIKTVLSDIDEVPILIFDEIDTGISGQAAKMVAEKMKKISKKHQLICITHLPVIAAMGDANYFISKVTKDNKTCTLVKKLSEDETITEIARILDGNDICEISLKHAMSLRKVHAW